MSSIKILIIDDDPDQAEILKTIISGGERDIEVCTSGPDALELLKKNLYQLILTDLSMPEVDGLAILKYVKEHHPQTEVIAVTAFGDWGVYAEALRLGAKEFISKPFNLPEIREIVARLCPAGHA